MRNFHLHPISGDPKVCKATIQCPFGENAPHFETLSEARAASEKLLEETYAALPVVSKNSTKKSPKLVGVFRAGDLTPPVSYFEDLDQLVSKIDATAPEGRARRRGSLYASPDLASHSRWLLGTRKTNSTELRIDPESTYIYPVEVYDDLSRLERRLSPEDFQEATVRYWESGMLYSDWLEWSKTAKPEHGTWELLIAPEAVAGSRPVSNRRVIEGAHENNASQVNWVLEPRRASKGSIWRKEPQAPDGADEEL